MKLLGSEQLAIPDIHVIRFGRFRDVRGYFTEPFRKSDFQNSPHTHFLRDVSFFQANESYSRAGVIRGLHFQWNPYMGKLVRTTEGHMIDLVVDIRRGSPTLGKIIAHDMPARRDEEHGEWIWVPPGFAHGNFFLEETVIEYFCSGEYSPGCEAGISPLSGDLDWSLCDHGLKNKFDELVRRGPLITDKDRDGLSLTAWLKDERSKNFM